MGKIIKKSNKVSVIRLSNYRNVLKRLKKIGLARVFSDNLADAVAVSPSQVRKDFSLFGIKGNKKAGYQLDELLRRLNEILGKDELQKIIIVGAGNIGTALMHYHGFAEENIKIVAAFDNDLEKCGNRNLIPVHPLIELPNVVKKHKVEIGIIAVPENAAQAALDVMIEAGIIGVLNFAPICLRASPHIIVNNVNVRSELENLIYYVKNRE